MPKTALELAVEARVLEEAAVEAEKFARSMRVKANMANTAWRKAEDETRTSG